MSFPSEGRGHKFESCRARQRIIGLAGSAVDRAAPSYPVATKFEKKDSSDRFMCVPPGSEEQQPSKLKVAGSNPAGVATNFNDLVLPAHLVFMSQCCSLFPCCFNDFELFPAIPCDKNATRGSVIIAA
jgi:hypothetical protein